MSITINHNQNGQNNSGTTTVTITVTSTTGNLLVLAFSTNSNANVATAVSDNVNGSYTQVGGNATGGTASMAMWRKDNAATGATTITVTLNNAVENCWNFWDLGGAAAASPLETSTPLSNQGPAANPSGPSVIVSGTADIILSGACTTTGITAVASPFTGAFPDAANTGSGFAWDNTSSSGTYSPSWTMTSGTWGGITAAFKAAAAAGNQPDEDFYMPRPPQAFDPAITVW